MIYLFRHHSVTEMLRSHVNIHAIYSLYPHYNKHVNTCKNLVGFTIKSTRTNGKSSSVVSSTLYTAIFV